ncbi:hypothetical protein H4Q26_007392 [Puccinia striiformis f. sp. tritici PST-130]|nr:hypothetical protein H4Q26_007392 [Puccinia striiformis f. sp. tritici PST-130]
MAEILGLPHSDPTDLERIWNGVESGKKEGGDLTIAVPRFRIKGSDPKQLAKKIQDDRRILVKFEMDSKTLCRTVLHQVNELTHLSAKETGGGYGTNSSGIDPSTGKKKKLVLEFSSTIIGAFLGNLHEANGWDVTRINYLGDWGRQFEIWYREGITRTTYSHLLDVYTKINKDMEGEEKATLEQKHVIFQVNGRGRSNRGSLMERFRDYSIKQYEQDYARLNIKFDVYSGESQVSHESMNVALKFYRKRNCNRR